jgi:CRISPR type III-B/RAMP module RAMP protein Cmr6
MSTLTLKINAAKTTRAWQLALDKIPFLQVGTAALPDKKIDVLQRAVRAESVKSEWQAAIRTRQEWLDRLKRQHGDGFHTLKLVNSSRLLLHLGRPSVLQNVGIHADRTTGLPVIPGSAVKGVLSTWACWSAHFDGTSGEFREFSKESVQRRNFPADHAAWAARIFGDNSESGSTHAGEIVFLGAFPLTLPMLEMDIVTPHTNPDGSDRNSPIPNPFLAIAPGTEWNFVFLPASSCIRDIQALFDQVSTWLLEALEQSGMGAKTASGYGRFLPLEKWRELTLDEKELAEIQAQQIKAAAKAAAIEELRSEAIGDYANETVFANAVLNRLNKPGEYQSLQAEVKRIESNPANAPWIEKITTALRENKDTRKRLKDKDWFPKSWLPQ